VLYDNFNEQARADARLAASSVRIDGSTLQLDPGTISSLEAEEHFFRLFDENGAMLTDTSDEPESIPLDQSKVQSALEGSESLSSVTVGDQTVVIVSEPVRNGTQVVGVIQTGANRTDVEETLAALLIGLGIAAPIMVILAAGGGYVVAGRVLRPVSQITDLAAGIGASDLHARLNLTLPDDELGRLASTFDAMLARIEEAFERQRRFTGDAAHELRTPLSLMRSQVDLALARPRTVAEYEEALAELDQDLARMTGLVATLLSLARSDSGTLTLDRSDIDLADTIEIICEQYADAVEADGISLTASTEPTPINADEDLLIQVLVNLLDNALAVTPSEGSIEVTCRAEPNCGAHLQVRDNGPGIAPEHIGRIFDRFYRVDTGRTRGRGGAGLGLSICRAIVNAHGGEITVESTVGSGTTFDVRLPGTPQAAQAHHRSIESGSSQTS
jgi:heavy metal sensor kinase